MSVSDEISIRSAVVTALRMILLKVSPSQQKNQRLFRRWIRLREQFCPVFSRVFKEGVKIDVVHQHDSLLHDHQKQVRDNCDPDLYLDGICAFPIEVP